MNSEARRVLGGDLMTWLMNVWVFEMRPGDISNGFFFFLPIFCLVLLGVLYVLIKYEML